jgi:hypothetical protein
VTLNWTAPSGSPTSYTIKRSTVSGGPYVVDDTVTSPGYTDTGLTNGTAYYYVVSASNAGGEGPNSGQASATPAASAWTNVNIGNATPAGSLSTSGGTVTVQGAGSDVWGTADNFHFAYQNATGDATITARVASVTNTNAWTKALVLMREGTATGARYVGALVSPTAANKYRLQHRGTTGGSTTSVASSPDSAVPVYLRVTRTGNAFAAYYSTNGTTFTQIGTSQTIAMASTIQVGLGLTSHANGTLATATFDNITISGGPPPSSGISNLVVNDTTTGSDGIVNSGQWSVQSSFAAGTTAFGDRTYTIDSIGNAVLTGKPWIRTAADSKASPANPLASFTLTGTQVYLLIDDRHNVSGRPPWLTDMAFTDQGYNVVVRQSASATYPYSVWRKTFTSGTTVNLPTVNSSVAPGYIVVVE